MKGNDHLALKRQVVALCMESPLYFTMPLRKRLDFVKGLEQQTYWSKLWGILRGWIDDEPAGVSRTPAEARSGSSRSGSEPA